MELELKSTSLTVSSSSNKKIYIQIRAQGAKRDSRGRIIIGVAVDMCALERRLITLKYDILKANIFSGPFSRVIVSTMTLVFIFPVVVVSNDNNLYE